MKINMKMQRISLDDEDAIHLMYDAAQRA